MPRQPDSHGRLLNLLYKKTVPEIKPKVPIVRRLLYDQDPDTDTKSILDDLMQSQWEQKPIESAMADAQAQAPNAPKSNVLRLSCANGYISRFDLHNIYPVIRDRSYFLSGDLKKGLNFHVVKGRNPYSLMFTGHYYLIFPNYNQACTYYLETARKSLNGVPMRLEFVSPTDTHLKQIGSPALASAEYKSPKSFLSLSENFRSAAAADVFAASEPQSQILSQLSRISSDRSQYTGTSPDPLSDVLCSFANVPSRYSQVVVRGLPFGVGGPTLENLFWDYEFANEQNPQKSILNLHTNPASQITMSLLKFKNEHNARNFVRNHHGRRWEKIHTRKVKAMYEPILCEIVD